MVNQEDQLLDTGAHEGLCVSLAYAAPDEKPVAGYEEQRNRR